MITKSYFTQEHDQVDGRCWVTETHIDEAGDFQVFYYLCDLKQTAPDQIMAERALLFNDIAAYEKSLEGLRVKADNLRALADSLIVLAQNYITQADAIAPDITVK